MCDTTITPAKRGRKPKSLTTVKTEEYRVDENIIQSPNASASTDITPVTTVKAKRGRKPKQVFLCSNQLIDTGKCMSEDENIVLNLKIFDVDQSMPDPYNNDDFFLSKPSEISEKNHLDSISEAASYLNLNTPSTTKNHKDPDISAYHNKKEVSTFKVVEILKDFEEKNKQNEWPTSTSIHCYWCCHKFNNVPYGIPVKYADTKFHVIGCFCSLECAAAYNMDNYDSVDDMWERYMLINMLSRVLNYKNIIKPAPSRLSLKAFGGHMEIDEFRSYCQTCKLINVNFPPMMTLTQQIEEINESDLNSDLKYIPIDTDRINKYKERMKLKRHKPITNFKNTLDHAMNLKIV
jgi:hypothetical protein